MRTLSTFLFALLFTSAFVFAQDAKDLSQKPVSFNNPLSVSGPALDTPLAAFYESFEGVTFPPAGWVKYNPDAGTGWARITAGTTPLPGWTGGTATAAPVTGSGTGMAYATWNTGGATSNDQWLVTPQIMNVQSGDSLKFWVRKFSNYADELQVKISTTGNAMVDFTTTVQNIVYASTDSGWVSYGYKLGDFVPNGSNIYIAFREIVADNFNDGDFLCIDEVKIVSGVNPNTFFDNFDSYTAGQLVACQNPTDWTTWSNAPCGAEDAEVSNAFSYSGSNSAKLIFNDDFVKPLGNKTTGKWYMSFLYYVPATKSGYFNTMNVFTLPSTFTWGMDVYFDAGGAGRIDTTGGGAQVPANVVNFTWSVAQWNQAIVIVDLGTQVAEFWTGTNPVNLTQIATWNWTQGGTKPNSLAVQDFFGAVSTNEMYIDDYFFSDEMPTVVPVELSAFSAIVSNGAVVLNWTTETELNNQGFQIERRTAEGQFVTIGSVQGNGTTTERKQYSYTDAGVETGNYYYRLKQIDFDGTFEYSNEIFVDVNPPLEFALGQNYPNPFNPTTTINFSIAEPTFVKLAIYNLLGEEVEVLKNEYMNAGSFNVSFDATSLPSGMYLYKVETAQYSSVRKMMLMK